jgi:hypothetical protein
MRSLPAGVETLLPSFASTDGAVKKREKARQTGRKAALFQ